MSDREVIQEYFALVAQDAASTKPLYAEECVLHYGGRHALSGDYHGVESILGMFRQSAAAYARPMSLRLKDLAASDSHVFALLEASVGDDSGSESWLRVVVFRLVDGLIAEQWLFDYDQALLADLQR